MTIKLNLPLDGGCQCRNIRYQITATPETLYACHCTDCQKQSSSAFGLSLWVARENFKLSNGNLKFWYTQGENGGTKECAFCPECGCRIYHAFGADESLSIKAGSLDDVSWLEPVAHIWTKSSHQWLTPSIKNKSSHPTEPEDFGPYIEMWDEQINH